MRAKKSLGQHFLHDSAVVGKIIAALDVRVDDNILEVGPGTGSLTRHLAAAGATIRAVEIDSRLTDKLREDFRDYSNVTITQANALALDPCSLFEEADSGSNTLSPWFKVVGNIPYYITGALIRHYLESRCRAERIVIMVQREVADRIVAEPGNMSVLAAATQFYATPSIVARVPSSSFRPRPKVASAVIRLVPRPEGHIDVPDAGIFFRLVKAGFSTRRKQLVNSLSHGLGCSKTHVLDLLECADIAPTSRPEDLSVEMWATLSYCFASRMARR